MQILKGPIARRLFVSLLGLILVLGIILAGSVWVVQSTSSTVELVLQRSELALLSARLRSESLALTELVQRYVSQSPDAANATSTAEMAVLRQQIQDKGQLLSQLLAQAQASINPNDIDESILTGKIFSNLVAFKSQAFQVLAVFDREQSYGAETRSELHVLIESYQVPLINVLQAFEAFEMTRADLASQQVQQAVRIMAWTVVLISGFTLVMGSLLILQVLLRLVIPLRRLRLGIDAIRGGRLEQPFQIAVNDEMGELAGALNSMAAELDSSRQQLEKYAHTLEAQVTERTHQAEHLILQAHTAAQITQAASGTLDLEELLRSSVELIHDRFNLYYVGLSLVDEAREYAWLRAATGEAGRALLERKHKLKLDNASMTGRCILNARPEVELDISETSNRYRNPLLLETRSEVTLPLITRGEVIGAITVQSERPDAFQPADITILQTMTGQLANVIGNAHLYQQIELEKVHAEAANRAKSVFLANMSHEIRTPLNAILGFTSLLQLEENLTEVQRANVRVIHRSSEALLSLINNILDLSKIEAGRVTLNEQIFNLPQMLEGLEDLFRLRALEKGLELVFDKAVDLPVYVLADEGKLRQVLINLLGNAIKFTGGVQSPGLQSSLPGGGPTGRVSLQVRTVGEGVMPLSAAEREDHRLAGRLDLQFVVKDTGPGIAPQFQEMIFEPFTQVGDQRVAQQGTGLGLAISRQFVHLMGGDITLSSLPNQGCTFAFVIPVHITRQALERSRPLRRVRSLAPNQKAPDGGAFRILVTDDSRDSRRWLTRLLLTLGFEAREASNGSEAVEIWRTWNPHLILMDLRMPVMNGLEATHRIRDYYASAARTGGPGLNIPTQPTRPRVDTVIVAMTASAFDDEHSRILEEGCNHILRKPVLADDLFFIMEKYLGVQFIESVKPGPVTTAMGVHDLEEPILTIQSLQPLADSPPDSLARPVNWDALSSEQVERLRQAVLLGDFDLIWSVIQEIEVQQAVLADVLQSYANRFDLRGLMNLLPQEKA